MMALFTKTSKNTNDISCQTDLSMQDLDAILNIPHMIKFKTTFHQRYFNKIKQELGSLPSEKEIDEKRWYYYKYMEPLYSDKIIHIYSSGNIGNGTNKMCVYCKQDGHIQRTCPIAHREGKYFTHNF